MPSGSRAYSVKTEKPGRTITSAPPSPASTAMRRGPSSRSFSIGTASTAATSGMTKPIAAASAIGICESAVM